MSNTILRPFLGLNLDLFLTIFRVDSYIYYICDITGKRIQKCYINICPRNEVGHECYLRTALYAQILLPPRAKPGELEHLVALLRQLKQFDQLADHISRSTHAASC